MAELNIPSWFNCVTPQFDILNNKLDESVFAANLGDVMMGMGNEIYLDPKQFFKKTYCDSRCSGFERWCYRKPCYIATDWIRRR